jgi:RNA-directed DNA polymerase
MSKAASKVGCGRSAPRVDPRQLQIVLPFDDGSTSDPASVVEDNREQLSGAATPTGEGSRKKRKWYSLYDKVLAYANLQRAWARVKRNAGSPGSDGQTIAQFARRLAQELLALQAELQAKTYRPRPVRRKEIDKGGGKVRRLGIPSVRDRVVQQAVAQILEPIFESKFSPRSHGFRPGRGCQSALTVVDRVLRRGYEWIVEGDICEFFDSVDHDLLLDAVHEEISDGSVLKLLRLFLTSGVQLESGEWEASELGTPQGGPISPLLANIYLHSLDVALVEAKLGLIRYADDFVILAQSREEAEQGEELARQMLDRLKLRLHPEKTRIVTLDDGFAFLGFHYRRDGKGRLQKAVSAKSLGRFREAVRSRTKRHAGQKRPKAKRCTLARLRKNRRVVAMIAELNRYLLGWHGYFRCAQVTWKDYFNDFDRFVRRRLRCVISGRYAKGRWQQLVPNETLDALGLICLARLEQTPAR